MQRIIGTEVEYGISSPADPTANPILTSTQAVLAYAAAAGIQRAKRTRWDYEVESPLRDARGFDLSRSAGPPPVVDADEVGAANMILTNGARLYVDHAHPEYAAPEHLERLRSRGLGTKRSLALREFALGIEALHRFVEREPLRRVHECVFGVLALESEPVDPRL